MSAPRVFVPLLALASLLGVAAAASAEAPPEVRLAPASDWIDYGGGRGGMRYAPLADVTPANVATLEVAWEHHGGDIADGKSVRGTSAYELTPILAEGTLYGCTPFNKVFALDPESGEERWRYDPEIDTRVDYANQFVCRGVSFWRDPAAAPDGVCAARIFTATNDARLIALDAASGRPCPGFGRQGEVDLTRGVGERRWPGEYQQTSPPAIVRDVVAVGSAVSDNGRIDAPSGAVRGFDARSGALRWAWDPVPPGFERREMDRREGVDFALGTPNVWAPMAVDEERDLLFAPTGNPAPDYFSAGRSGLDHYGSSVVALRGATGEVVWHFQTVHKDVWDYDVASQPTLVELERDGEKVPAVIQGTKMGFVFVLHRETGEPLFPVEERPVPQGGVPGEVLSPTQPFPVKPPPLADLDLEPGEAYGVAWLDARSCRKQREALRFEGIYTPPSLQGTLAYPGNGGGINWGGVAVEPGRQILVANLMNMPFVIWLFPAEEYEAQREQHPGVEIAPQRGTPYGLRRERFMSPLGLPCTPPPWGELAAVDLGSGELLWKRKLGTIRDLAPPLTLELGVPNIGGPLVTAGGLVFIGATMDDYLRAFDLETGEELWKGRLPAGGQATPMSYRARPGGPQMIVIAAGGHGRMGTRLGDSLVAFRLPADPSEAPLPSSP